MERRVFIKKAGVTLTGLIASASLPAPVLADESGEKRYGYEGELSGHLAYTGENIVFPSDAEAVVNVTKPPYNCDNRGRIDCTEALKRAIDDIVRPTLIAQKELEKEMTEDPRTDFRHELSAENRKENGVVKAVFPVYPSPSKILYFPNGTYKVSDTISYTFEDLHNWEGNELNRQIIVRGQNEKGVIIKLIDNCPGFEKGNNKPVFSFMRKHTSTVAMVNLCENITINTGAGNNGASGLRFFCNNMGAVRNVSIISGDREKVGAVGLLCDRVNFSGCLMKNITIDGFDYGVQVLPQKMNAVFEHITLRNQKKGGFVVDETPVSIRGLISYSAVPALALTGQAGHVVIFDSELYYTGTGDNNNDAMNSNCPAIEHIHGVLFARNIKVGNYAFAIGKFGNQILAGTYIDEYSSHGVFTAFENQVKKTLSLPVEETPDIPWEQDMKEWVSVNKFGAVGDGITDDTNAIQKALDSGKAVVYFQPGRYLINGQIKVSGTVRRINFMFCNLVAGEKLRSMTNQGTFKIDGFSGSPLIMEDLFAFEEYKGQQYLIDHASARTLVLSDMQAQLGAMYFNSVGGGTVFIENVACTDQFQPKPNCFSFKNQKVWARQLNPERANPQVINEGSQLWIMGYKTEDKGVGFHTSNQGSTEIMGGVLNSGGDGEPYLINDNSNVSVICTTRGRINYHASENFVMEKRKDKEITLKKELFPKRILFLGSRDGNDYKSFTEQYFVPLYVGYEK